MTRRTVITITLASDSDDDFFGQHDSLVDSFRHFAPDSRIVPDGVVRFAIDIKEVR